MVGARKRDLSPSMSGPRLCPVPVYVRSPSMSGEDGSGQIRDAKGWPVGVRTSKAIWLFLGTDQGVEAAVIPSLALEL